MLNLYGTSFKYFLGPRGSGKTQAACVFCKEVKGRYSVIATLMAKDDSRLTDDLKIFARNLGLDLPVNFNREKLLNEIIGYLNRPKHKDCLYLLFIDNLTEKKSVKVVIDLLKNVKNMHILLATYDATLVPRFKKKTVIPFSKGLNEEECKNVLKYGGDLIISEDEIKALIEFITPFPLIINSARLYMIWQKKSVEEYKNSFNEMSSEKYKAFDGKDEAYELNILESQCMPLRCIKSWFGKEEEILWEVMMLLPFFQYHSVSTVLLEACFFHKTGKVSMKKRNVDKVIYELIKYSLCEIVKKASPKIHFRANEETGASISEKEKKEDRCFTFLELTMRALEDVDNDGKDESEINECRASRIQFLLKMFCYEIDPDSTSDDVLERNVLFLDQAKDFITNHQDVLFNEMSKENRFFLSFLNCAIGSTLYYQRMDVELGHKYLMRARGICLDIAEDSSFYTTKECPYQNDCVKLKEVGTPEKIKQVSDFIFELGDSEYSTDIIEKFVLHKRRSRTEIDAIKNQLEKQCTHRIMDLYESHYLSEKDHSFLMSNNLAIPLNKVKSTFLHELLIRILHNNRRALKELYYRTEEDQHVRQARNNEFFTSDEFCKLIKEKEPTFLLTVCLENDRSSRMLKTLHKQSIRPNELEDDIAYYEEMLKEQFGFYFEFGVLKISDNSNDHHKCECLGLLLRLLYNLYKLEKNEQTKLEIYEKGTNFVDTLEKKLLDIEKKKRKYMWLSFPLMYIQCGKFLQLSAEKTALERAIQMFKKGTVLEESRGVSWTRYIREGYYGEMACLKKLERNKDVKEKFALVESKLNNTSKTNQLNYFKTLNIDVWI